MFRILRPKIISVFFLAMLFFPTLYGAEESIKGERIREALESLSWEGWVTLLIFAITFFALFKEVQPPDIVMLISSGILVVIGILSPVDFLVGFSNDILMTIGLMFVLVRAMEINGILDVVARNVLTSSKNSFVQITSLMVPVAGLSAFLNNTPIVLMMAPIVRRWALDHKLFPTKFLIPLSYAAVLGGCCTIIGTSTNLLIEGMLRKTDPPSSLGFFELAKIGVPITIAGVLYILFIGQYLLPKRKDPTTRMEEQTRELTAEFIVEPDSPLVKKTVKESFRRFVREELLIQIVRGGNRFDSPGQDFMIEAGDVLVFVGGINQIAELHGIEGLSSVADPLFKLDVDSSHFSEVVISTTSLLIGKTVRKANFRTNYGASVIAVFRQGRRVERNVGDIVLRAGDILMLLTTGPWHGGDFYEKDFYPIRLSEKLEVYNPWRIALVLTTAVAMITAATMGIPIMIAALSAALFLVFTKSISIREAQRNIRWNVLLLIAGSLAFGKALVNTGVAHSFAKITLAIVGENPYMITGGIILIALIATEFVSNNAAAVIFFPIALEMAQLAGYTSPEATKAVGIAIAIGCSAAFAIPTGYQTHMIVYAIGGYRFSDFIFIGSLLNLIILILGTLLIPMIWPLT